MPYVLAKGLSHLVGKSSGDNHTVGLARTRPGDDSELIGYASSWDTCIPR